MSQGNVMCPFPLHQICLSNLVGFNILGRIIQYICDAMLTFVGMITLIQNASFHWKSSVAGIFLNVLGSALKIKTCTFKCPEFHKHDVKAMNGSCLTLFPPFWNASILWIYEHNPMSQSCSCDSFYCRIYALPSHMFFSTKFNKFS